MKSILAVILFFFIATGAQASISFQEEQSALNNSMRWLQLVDAGQYDESWKDSASLFQNKVTTADWKKAVTTARAPLGKLLNRKFKSKTFVSELPNVPKGKYLVIQYEANFEKKKQVIETVTPMLDKDGSWKVSGYFVN